MTWRYALLAFTIGVLFMVGQTAFAHDHPPPKTCEDWCSDSQCKCWDSCKAGRNTMTCLGEPACYACTDRCDEKKDQCSTDCDSPRTASLDARSAR